MLPSTYLQLFTLHIYKAIILWCLLCFGVWHHLKVEYVVGGQLSNGSMDHPGRGHHSQRRHLVAIMVRRGKQAMMVVVEVEGREQ